MTKEYLATWLNGREYGDEMLCAEEEQAQKSGLVVVFGASDDLIELRGAIDDEDGSRHGKEHYVTRKGLFEAHDVDSCECAFCGYKDAKSNAAVIKAIWGQGDYSWQYETTIPHATFEIMEDGKGYCRGIVFSINDLK